MRYFGCLTDGRVVPDTEAGMRAHLGHRLVAAEPTWWGRIVLWWTGHGR